MKILKLLKASVGADRDHQGSGSLCQYELTDWRRIYTMQNAAIGALLDQSQALSQSAHRRPALLR